MVVVEKNVLSKYVKGFISKRISFSLNDITLSTFMEFYKLGNLRIEVLALRFELAKQFHPLITNFSLWFTRVGMLIFQHVLFGF